MVQSTHFLLHSTLLICLSINPMHFYLTPLDELHQTSKESTECALLLLFRVLLITLGGQCLLVVSRLFGVIVLLVLVVIFRFILFIFLLVLLFILFLFFIFVLFFILLVVLLLLFIIVLLVIIISFLRKFIIINQLTSRPEHINYLFLVVIFRFIVLCRVIVIVLFIVVVVIPAGNK